jgi:glycosyltransferase involved in cell wall biosynthesis
MSESPRLSVVVPTYGRPAALQVAMRSVLSSSHDSFELIVVDQNAESDFGEFESDQRVRVLRVKPVGVSAARNLGTKAARSEWVAFMDDDCEASPGWLHAIEAVFEQDAGAGVILGNVLAGEHDAEKGFVPACIRNSQQLHRRLTDCPEIEVMGASMAVRKSSWERVGGFWEAIGPGKSMKAGEDYDLVVRALRIGIGVRECPEAAVVHHGFRPWAEGQALIEGYAYGTAYVIGYRVGWRPVEMSQCLWRFWRSYRAGRSKIVQSARHAAGNRMLHFGRGLVAGAVDGLRGS